jgi:hypothetical protein
MDPKCRWVACVSQWQLRCGVALGTCANGMNGRVIQKATPCITRIQDLTVEVTYSLWDLMTTVFRMLACYTTDGPLINLRNGQGWFWDFSAWFTKNFVLIIIYQNVILSLI